MNIFQDIFPVDQKTLKPLRSWSKPAAYEIPPGHVYGLPTGPRNGVWVLDLDVKNGKDGVAAIETYMRENDTVDLPDTLTVRTKNGGLHLYFQMPAGRRIGNRVGVLPGVDVRGDGGFVYAGGPYVVEESFPVADAPEWLLGLVEAKEAAPVIPVTPVEPTARDYDLRIERAANFLKSAPPCVAGAGGQAQQWSVALRLSRDLELPVDASMFLVRAYNERCSPPWNMGDWQRVFERAAEHGTTAPGLGVLNFMPATPSAPAAALETAPSVAWRQRPNPQHVYLFDTANVAAGPEGKPNQLSQKDLATMLIGPDCPQEMWRGVWQYDTFARRVRAVNPPLKLRAETTGLETVDALNIGLFLSTFGYTATKEKILDAISTAAERCQVHPVREYLAELPPPSIEAAEDYFAGIAGRLWGATEWNARESDFLRRWAIAAVRRVRRPGTKVDTMLVLQGKQGTNKSRFVELLASPAWYSDQVRGLDGKEGSISIEGVWIAELSELSAFVKLPEAQKKAFLSCNVDKYRPHYERGIIERPRETVFIGTTNADEFLDDETGDRRYHVCAMQRPIDLKNFDRDAFWAAAAALESAGEPHWYEASETSEAASPERRNAQFRSEDPWTPAIERYMGTLPLAQDYVVAAECLTYATLMSIDKQTDWTLKRVQKVLRSICGPSFCKRFGARFAKVYPLAAWRARQEPRKVP